MPRQPTPTIRRWQLGQELRKLREAASVTAKVAAGEIEVSPAALSKIETGKQTIKPLYVKLLAALYGASTNQRGDLLSLAEGANAPEWFVAHSKHIPNWFRLFLGYEASAATIRTYAVELVDGLFQTEAYARAIGLANQPESSPRDLDSYLALRRDRQNLLLAGDNPPALHAVINEAALRRMVGGTDVMREQLQHIADMAELDHVTVQVLPFSAGAHPAMTAPFTVLGFDLSAMDCVYLENGRGALYLEGPADLRRYAWMLDRLTDLALTPDASRALLRTVADEL